MLQSTYAAISASASGRRLRCARLTCCADDRVPPLARRQLARIHRRGAKTTSTSPRATRGLASATRRSNPKSDRGSSITCSPSATAAAASASRRTSSAWASTTSARWHNPATRAIVKIEAIWTRDAQSARLLSAIVGPDRVASGPELANVFFARRAIRRRRARDRRLRAELRGSLGVLGRSAGRGDRGAERPPPACVGAPRKCARYRARSGSS